MSVEFKCSSNLVSVGRAKPRGIASQAIFYVVTVVKSLIETIPSERFMHSPAEVAAQIPGSRNSTSIHCILISFPAHQFDSVSLKVHMTS